MLEAVLYAVGMLGGHCLVLGAVPSIRDHWPWDNVMAMVEEWRHARER